MVSGRGEEVWRVSYVFMNWRVMGRGRDARAVGEVLYAQCVQGARPDAVSAAAC